MGVETLRVRWYSLTGQYASSGQRAKQQVPSVR
jgi:hypothetical protein